MKVYLNLSLLIFFISGSLLAQDLSTLKDQKPVSLSGGVFSNLAFRNVSGRESQTNPFIYVIGGNLNTSVYQVNIPIHFTYSNNNFSRSKPFNRFGISPYYKWVKVHLGYCNMQHSSFTLAGNSFLGAGIELTPGKLRFSSAYGRFNKKVYPNTSNPMDTLVKPTRKGFSVKLGYGDDQNFVDLIYLNIKDDILSFSPSENLSSLAPQENNVGGINFQVKLSERITWQGEGAFSILTKDLNAIDIGSNSDILQKMPTWININSSSEYAKAIDTKVQYSASNFSLGLQYRIVDPNYTSFGAYYFNTDLENYTLNTMIRIFKRQLTLRGSVGWQNDNLKNKKAATSSRFISKFQIQYNSGKAFSIDGSYSNYSINQKAGQLPLNDTLKIYQANRNISLSPRLLFQNSRLQQLVQFNYTSAALVEHNDYKDGTDVNSDVYMLYYMRTYLQTGLNFTAGFTYTSIEAAVYTRTTTGINAGVGKTFMENKLSTNINASVNKSQMSSENGWITTANLQLNYRPHKKHNFRFTLYSSKSTSSENKNYSEIKTLISYAYKF